MSGDEKTDNRGASLPLPETLTYDGRSGHLWSPDHVMVADMEGDEGLARLRGWGYLTGAGGLGLTDNEAAAYQDRIGARMALAWRTHDELLEACRRALRFITNGVEFGYITLPDEGSGDPALETPDFLRTAIANGEGDKA